MSAFDIDPATWATLDRLLDEALDLPPEERGRWLEELPPEHRALLPRLRRLLEHASSDTSSGPRLDTLPDLVDPALRERLKRRP